MGNLFEISKHKFELKDNQITVIDTEIQKSINKTKLSPSMVNSVLSSSGDYILNKYLSPLVEKEPIKPLILGNWYHSIMEYFYKEEPSYRTLDKLKKVAELITEHSYSELSKDKENQEWIKSALRGYWSTFGKSAKQEKIASVFINGKTQEGIELFVGGSIGKCKRFACGFIDRLLEGNSGLIIDDWKTGKYIYNYDINKKISESNSFDYARQQTFYTLILENKGFKIEEARLTFPMTEPPQVISIDIHNPDIRKQTISDFEKAESVLNKCIENNYTFELKKGKYNGWATLLCGLGNATVPSVYEDKMIEYLKVN